MEKYSDATQEEKIREYLKLYVKTYAAARNRIGIPVDEEKLIELIDSATIELFKDENMSGTFSVNQLKKWIAVIVNNFEKNGKKRNDFLLLHEMTHLSSYNNLNMYTRLRDDNQVAKFGESEKVINNSDMSGTDVFYGVIAIEEVVAQWMAEKCDEALGNGNRTSHKETHRVLGTDIDVTTDFDNNDTYAPLETYVEAFSKKIGFSSFEDFAKAVVTGEIDLFDYINESNIEYLGYIGILCEGIYQENGFSNPGLPESDIPKAITYLENNRLDIPFSDNPDTGDR